jgi:hypothetical protein
MKIIFATCATVFFLTAMQYQTGVNLAITMTTSDKQHELAILPTQQQRPEQQPSVPSIDTTTATKSKDDDARGLRGQTETEGDAGSSFADMNDGNVDDDSFEEDARAAQGEGYEEENGEEEDVEEEEGEEEEGVEEDEEEEEGVEEEEGSGGAFSFPEPEITNDDKTVNDADYENYVNAASDIDDPESIIATSPSESVEAVIAEPPNISPNSGNRQNDTLSSCLMVMDDNHRLTEWIAYHYTVMNLRHLVILSDSRSRLSPHDMLQKWKPYITIEEWTEADYMDKSFAKRAKEFLSHNQTDFRVQQSYHMERQSKFIRKCALHMQDLKKTWVSFHDIDEYYVINSKLIKNAEERMDQPGAVLDLLNSVQTPIEHLDALIAPTMFENYAGPCVTTYRVPYGAVQSTDEEKRLHVPSYVDPEQFETLRWRHQKKPGQKSTQIGKSLLDVSRVPDLVNMAWPDRAQTPFSPHRLVPICPGVFYTKDAFLRINHYVGSWAYYTYRVNDGRKGAKKTREAWETKADLTGGDFGDEARPWVQSFVRIFGETESVRLLANAGLPANYTAPGDDSDWIQRVKTFKKKKKKKKNTESSGNDDNPDDSSGNNIDSSNNNTDSSTNKKKKKKKKKKKTTIPVKSAVPIVARQW